MDLGALGLAPSVVKDIPSQEPEGATAAPVEEDEDEEEIHEMRKRLEALRS